MRHLTTTLCFALVASSVTAQEGRATKTDGNLSAVQAKTKHVALDDVIGADVRLRPSAEARREAAEDGDRAEGPTGEIDDVIIDVADGTIGWAVVSVGGILGIGDKTVLLPYGKLNCEFDEDGKPAFTLGMTKASLEACPAFDADKAMEKGLAQAVASHAVTGGAARVEREVGEASKQGRRDRAEAMGKRAKKLVMASKLKDCAVRANSEEFGAVDQCFIDSSRHCIDFIVVSHGGVAGIGDETFLVPMAAFQTVQHDDAMALMVPKSKQTMTVAPKFKAQEDGLNPVDPAAAKLSRDFFDTDTNKPNKTKK